MPKDLEPRDKHHDKLNPDQLRVMQEIEELSKDQSVALATLAQAQAGTLEVSEEIADTLGDLKAMFVKTMLHFSIPLPASIQRDIDEGNYSPDEIQDADDEEDEDKEPEVK